MIAIAGPAYMTTMLTRALRVYFNSECRTFLSINAFLCDPNLLAYHAFLSIDDGVLPHFPDLLAELRQQRGYKGFIGVWTSLHEEEHSARLFQASADMVALVPFGALDLCWGASLDEQDRQRLIGRVQHFKAKIRH